MQELDVNETILIVVGADIKPEEKDRPLAYWLQKKIQEADGYGKTPFRKSVVISDALYNSDKIIQACPTICIGGPGVNSLANDWVKSLPVYISEDNRYFIQYDMDLASPRSSRRPPAATTRRSCAAGSSISKRSICPATSRPGSGSRSG